MALSGMRPSKEQRIEFFKKKNAGLKKNEPLEMSCRKSGGANSFLEKIAREESKGFDPRFDERCGEVDKMGITKNYAFLQDYRKRELKELIESKAEFQDQEEYKKRLQSLKDQIKTNDAKIDDLNERIAWHREEKQRVLEGKKPYWMTKSEIRDKQQEKKFNELKDSGKLQSYLKKRREKLMKKDRRDAIRNKL